MRYASLAIVFVSIPLTNRLQKYDNYSIRQKIIPHITKSSYLCSPKQHSIIVMTAVDIKAAINNDLSTFPPDLLQVVADYVQSLRKKNEGAGMPITPLVASMFTGHSVNVTDAELDAAREEYLREKYL